MKKYEVPIMIGLAAGIIGWLIYPLVWLIKDHFYRYRIAKKTNISIQPTASRFVRILAFIGYGLAKTTGWYRPFQTMSDPKPTPPEDYGMTDAQVLVNVIKAREDYLAFVESSFIDDYEAIFQSAEAGNVAAITYVMSESTLFETILDEQVVSQFVDNMRRNQRP